MGESVGESDAPEVRLTAEELDRQMIREDRRADADEAWHQRQERRAERSARW